MRVRLDVGAGPRLNQVDVTGTNYQRSVDFYKKLGLKQIVDNPPDYARFETAGGATFSVQIDPEEKIIATTAVYLRVRRSRPTGRAARPQRNSVRAWPAQPAVDVARSAASRSRRQYHLLLQGRRIAPLPAVADGRMTLTQARENSRGQARLRGFVPSCLGESRLPAFVWTVHPKGCTRRLDAAALFLQARARLSATAGGRGRGGLRAACRAGRGRRLHPRPRQISRAASTIPRTCRSTSARRSTPA